MLVCKRRLRQRLLAMWRHLALAALLVQSAGLAPQPAAASAGPHACLALHFGPWHPPGSETLNYLRLRLDTVRVWGMELAHRVVDLGPDSVPVAVRPFARWDERRDTLVIAYRDRASGLAIAIAASGRGHAVVFDDVRGGRPKPEATVRGHRFRCTGAAARPIRHAPTRPN